MRMLVLYFLLMLGNVASVFCSPDGMRLLFTGNANFVYDYPTAVVHNDEPGFKLPSSVEAVAKVINRSIGQSIFFNTEFLNDIPRARRYHAKKKPNKANIGLLCWVTTVDNMKLGCTYFNRGSSKLLIVGGGFTNAREQMSPFVDMFPDYDVVLMDFRGHGFNPEVMTLNPIKKAFGIDPAVVTFGVREHCDVFAMVESFRRQKKANNNGVGYEHVYGLGVCYSAFVFTKAAALAENLRSGDELHPEVAEFSAYSEVINHGLFDKLVLDGCWLSLPLFVEKIRDDIATLDNPQSGGLANHWFFSASSVKSAVDFIATHIVGLQHHSSICLLDYVGMLTDTPLLFFFGKDDYMIRRIEFETLYNAIPVAEKTVIVTSSPHVLNHLKQKELYKLSCDLFFQLPQASFIDCLRSPEQVVHHTRESFSQACAAAMLAEGQN